MKIEITFENGQKLACMSVIAVPEIALSEPGHIRTFTAGPSAQSKHEFHALGQMALMQFEDGETTPREIEGDICVSAGDETLRIESGAVICRPESGELAIYINAGRPVRKFLETANRFCTRWIRLDI